MPHEEEETPGSAVKMESSDSEEQEEEDLPSYKDQARNHRKEIEAMNRDSGVAEVENMPAAGRPAFKDQVEEEVPAALNPDRGVVFANAQPLDGPGINVPEDDVVTAHVLDEEQQQAKRKRARKRVVIIVAVALALAIVAGFVGGYCGNGNCDSSNRGDDGASPSAAPATASPAAGASPSAAPTTASTVAEAVVQFINSIARSGNTIAYPPPVNPSAEELAVQWLVEEDGFQISLETEEERTRLVQRYALSTLWLNTNGREWSTNTNWLTSQSECDEFSQFWFGIRCDANAVVTEIDLSENNLKGRLPADITLLTSLTFLKVSKNSLSGSLPSEIGEWTRMENFNLHQNLLTGTLPSSINQWTNLTYFDVGSEWDPDTSNMLRGPLPDSLGTWTGLRHFDVSWNEFTGTLPDSIGQWTNLNLFLAHQNALMGALPASIGQWSKLTKFYVETNAFTGRLPDSIGQWTSVESFSIANNEFTGTLPDWIGRFTDLFFFFVYVNTFTGTIPESIGNWTKIQHARFDHNNFNGTVPSGICDVADLGTLEADCAFPEIKNPCSCCDICH